MVTQEAVRSEAAARLPPLRIAQVAPPLEAVPPGGYGGTERIVDELLHELERRGHEVTLFASGDSTATTRLVPTVERALRPLGRVDDGPPYTIATLDAVLRRASSFDLIHAHLEFAGLVLARATAVPVVNTFHGRIDQPWASALLAEAPPGLVAISHDQASSHPEVALDRRPQRPHPGRCPVPRAAGRRPLLRRPDGSREGPGRRGPHRPGGRAAPPRGLQGAGDAGGVGLLHRRLPAGGGPGGRGGARRAERAGPGRAVRHELRDAHAGRLAGAVRPGGDRVAGLRHARRRAAGGRPARDRARRPRRRPRRRPGRAGAAPAGGGDDGPAGDPRRPCSIASRRSAWSTATRPCMPPAWAWSAGPTR